MEKMWGASMPFSAEELVIALVLIVSGFIFVDRIITCLARARSSWNLEKGMCVANHKVAAKYIWNHEITPIFTRFLCQSCVILCNLVVFSPRLNTYGKSSWSLFFSFIIDSLFLWRRGLDPGGNNL
jgi:hypothetical protein